MDSDIASAYAAALGMPPALREVALKVVRATENRKALGEESSAYLERQPYITHADAKPNPPRYVLRVEVTEDPPPIISLCFGDFLQNLRSALDYMARQLVISNGGIPIDEPPRSGDRRLTSFPIHDREPEKGIYVAGGVSEDALTVIEKLQPYHRTHKNGRDPVEDPLWILNDLARIDRHRLLHLTIFSGGGLGELVFPETGDRFPFHVRLKDGAQTVIPVSANLLEHRVEVHEVSAMMNVALQEREIMTPQNGVWTTAYLLAEYITQEVLPPLGRLV